MSQSVRSWNVRFDKQLPEDSPWTPCPPLGCDDARTLTHEIPGATQAELSAALKGSPMKHAKLRGLKRNAAVVLNDTARRPPTGNAWR